MHCPARKNSVAHCARDERNMVERMGPPLTRNLFIRQAIAAKHKKSRRGETPLGIPHVGLLVNGSSGPAGIPFI